MNLHLLPHLRRGLARTVPSVDPLAGGMTVSEVTASLSVGGRPVAMAATLDGPNRVAALAPGEVIRRWPLPGATGVEPNLFPLIELASADLPWRFTPAAPAAHGRLRPWLTLVVVNDDVGYTAPVGDQLARLSVPSSEISQLPPLSESWAWAHVHADVPATELAARLPSDPTVARARLIAARRLAPDTTYRAAVVRCLIAGLNDDSIVPAWGGSEETDIELDVFDSWTFTTGPDGDFEALCRRLAPAPAGLGIGTRAVDVTDPGVAIQWNRSTPVIAELSGVFVDIGTPPPKNMPAFGAAVEPIVNAGASPDPPVGASYDPLVDDPVLAPPNYGAGPSGNAHIAPVGWHRELNLTPTARMAAGIGAAAVRSAQESLVAAAWDQVGELRQANDELNRGRLAAEIGRVWSARVAGLGDGDRLVLAARLRTFATVEQWTANEVLAAGTIPAAAASPAWLRRAPRAAGQSASSAYARAADNVNEERGALAFRQLSLPAGTRGWDPSLASSRERPPAVLDEPNVRMLDTPAMRGQLTIGAGELQRRLDARPVRVSRQPLPEAPGSLRRTQRERRVVDPIVAAVPNGTEAVLNALDALADPLVMARKDLVARVAGLSAVLPSTGLPSSVVVSPRFDEPLLWVVRDVDRDIVAPGIGEFPMDRVRLLRVCETTVAAMLVGANSELGRELLWREFPVDLAGTYFHRFLPRTPPSDDIGAIAEWRPDASLADAVGGVGTDSVVLVRGEVVRRYPTMQVLLAPALSAGAELGPDITRAVAPSFEVHLGNDTRVAGFPVDPAELPKLGAWYIVFEERVSDLRFGLDAGDGAATSTVVSWGDVSWDQVDAEAPYVPVAAPAGVHGPIDGLTWGRNSAHLAAATYQRPFRMIIPTTDLVAER